MRGHPPASLVLLLALGACSPAGREPEPGASAAPATAPASTGRPEELTPAERAFLDGRLDRAIDLLEDGRRDATESLLLAYALVLSGDQRAAARVLDETMRAPHYTDEHRFRTLLALVTGDLDRALAELAAGGVSPRPFFSRVLHVEVLTLARRFDAALAEADALAKDFPDEPIVPHARGHLESARGNWKAAIEAYTRSAALGGPNPDLDDGIAAARIALGQYREARRAIDRCREAFPDYVEILYQAIRLERLKPGASGRPLGALAAEYSRRSKRKERVAEVAGWTAKP